MPSRDFIRNELLRRLRGDHTASDTADTATHSSQPGAPTVVPRVSIIPLASRRGRSGHAAGAGAGGTGREVGVPRPTTRPGGDRPPEFPGSDEGVHHHYHAHAHAHHYHFYGAASTAPAAPLPVQPPLPARIPLRADWPLLPRRAGYVALSLLLLGALLTCLLLSLGMALLGQLAALH
jgi:hypothetical protein